MNSNYNIMGVILLSAGIVLMYGAVADKDPRDVVKEALSGKLKLGLKPKESPKESGDITPITPVKQGGDGTQVVSV